MTATLIAGGRSNLTYLLADAAGNRWVLRRPPLHAVLPSAHDVAREHRLMAALAPTPVPVPVPVGCEDAGSLLGAPFFVMEFVDGIIVRDDVDASRLTLQQRRRAGQSLVDVLANLHAVDPEEVGLGDLSRHDDYISRQLRGLGRQLHRGREHGTRDLPVLDEAHRRLADAVPPQQSVAIVHGDYRLDNVILAPDAQILAVLDWELCTLGDPLADLGMLAVFWPDSRDEAVEGVATQTVVDGFPHRQEAIERYARRTGRDLSRLDYYRGFASWKLAVILEGVRARFASGAYGDTEDESWRVFERVVPWLGERALAALDADAAAQTER